MDTTAVRREGLSRRFFVAYGAGLILVAIVGFAPSFWDYFHGELYFPPIVHLHGAVMLAWLLLYTIQARLPSSGNLALHRRLGLWSIVIASAVWLSMVGITIEAFRRFDPAEGTFLAQVLLIQLGIIVLYASLVTAGLLRRNDASWHRRLMTLSAIVLLQASVDRMFWIPDEGLPMFWHHAIRLYLLIVPLFVFDLVSLRRLHPATLVGSAVIVSMHALVSHYWDDPNWIVRGMAFWNWIRA